MKTSKKSKSKKSKVPKESNDVRYRDHKDAIIDKYYSLIKKAKGNPAKMAKLRTEKVKALNAFTVKYHKEAA